MLSDDDFDRFRATGDPVVDTLVDELLAHTGHSHPESFGRLGYNNLLSLTESLLESPELLLARDSALHKQLEDVPAEFAQYFMPEPAPDWVDAEKLRLGATLWSRWTLPIFLTLYVKSLPTCYLVRTGIAALYETGKLRDKSYISQRLYETSLFLDAVLHEGGGITVVRDIGPTSDTHLAETLNALDVGGGWHWQGRQLVRAEGKETHFTSEEFERINEGLESRGNAARPRRYLWGPGYINAKKVRFLHASLRYMLLYPERFPTFQAKRPEDGKFHSLAEAHGSSIRPWDVAARGVPISQDQQAFALITFGNTILEGLDRWGIQTTEEERRAYLHVWKVAGHIMGVPEQLMSDDPNECKVLMQRLMERDGGSSENGYVLTEALIDWLKDYLPPTLGMNEYLASYLIKWQLGEHASLVLRPETLARCGVGWRGALFHTAIGFFQVYDRVRTLWMRVFGGTGGLVQRIHTASHFVIESLRGAYDRRPFYLPMNPTQWVRTYGATPQFIALQRRWRRRMFDLLGLGVGAAITSRALTAIAVVLFLFGYLRPALGVWIAALLAEVASRWVLDRRIPAVHDQRPKISEQGPIQRAPSGSPGSAPV